MHETTNDERFTGREGDLQRLENWGKDRSTRLISITGMGGQGKTSLVGHWLKKRSGAGCRSVEGIFFWSFYAERSVAQFMLELKRFAEEELDFTQPRAASPTEMAIEILRMKDVMVVLDGLEVLQETPGKEAYGALLDLDLREFLLSICRVDRPSLVVLTSRFPFKDLNKYLGISHHSLLLEHLTPQDGGELLSRCGVEGPEKAREEVSRRYEGHPLALRVFASALTYQADRDPTRLLDVLFDSSHRHAKESLQGKISRLLIFYEDAMPEPRKALMWLVSLFRSPIDHKSLKYLSKRSAITSPILGHFTDSMLRQTFRQLRSEQMVVCEKNDDGEELYSCHPILKDHFRQSMTNMDQNVAMGVADMLKGRPAVENPQDVRDIEPVLSAIELLQQVGRLQRADELYQGRLQGGHVFRLIPSPDEGFRCASGFVLDSKRQAKCLAELGRRKLCFYLNSAAINAGFAGELDLAENFHTAASNARIEGDSLENELSGMQNRTWVMVQLGRLSEALELTNEMLLMTKFASKAAQVRSHIHMAYVQTMTGDSSEALAHFEYAERLYKSVDDFHADLPGLSSIWWAELSYRTGFMIRASSRIKDMPDQCEGLNWREDLARCRLLQGKIALATSSGRATEFLTESEAIMRKGHMLTELPQLLVTRAMEYMTSEKWAEAIQAADEALDLSRLRNLLPSQADALIARGKIILKQTQVGGEVGANSRRKIAKDDANCALNLSRGCGYRWAERDGLSLLSEASSSLGEASLAADYLRQMQDLNRQLKVKGFA